jgi:hypothetical protein
MQAPRISEVLLRNPYIQNEDIMRLARSGGPPERMLAFFHDSHTEESRREIFNMDVHPLEEATMIPHMKNEDIRKKLSARDSDAWRAYCFRWILNGGLVRGDIVKAGIDTMPKFAMNLYGKRANQMDTPPVEIPSCWHAIYHVQISCQMGYGPFRFISHKSKSFVQTKWINDDGTIATLDISAKKMEEPGWKIVERDGVYGYARWRFVC